jgi:predicted outer membrane repeat protein
VYASANVVLKRLVLQRGAFSSSHALENFGMLLLDQVTMRNNVSTGAAVLNQNNLIVERSTFAGNTNSGTGINGHGGAILNDGGTAKIRDSTFSNNAAATGGGAIYSTSEVDVSNVTFTGNQTTAAGSGGAAIYQTGGGASAVTYATVSGNVGAGYGGGLVNDSSGSAAATLIVSRSIIANNTNGNCDGVLTSGGYNLWYGTTSCPFGEPGDGAGDPKLGALASNGGLTQTMLPQADSAAIDRIPAAQCMIPVDQRGGGRPSGSGCDSGAVEVGAVLDLIFYDGFE